MKRIRLGLALLMLVTLATGAQAREVIRQFKGSESRNTAEFDVEAPWILDWNISTDYPGKMAVDVALETGGTGACEGSVLKTQWPGNGVRKFDQSGRFYFHVNSSFANWTLKVIQLTPEEAAEYTPKKQP